MGVVSLLLDLSNFEVLTTLLLAIILIVQCGWLIGSQWYVRLVRFECLFHFRFDLWQSRWPAQVRQELIIIHVTIVDATSEVLDTRMDPINWGCNVVSEILRHYIIINNGKQLLSSG